MGSATQVRLNAQAELRENLRTILRERRISQHGAALRIGMNQPRMTSCLNGTWFTREVVQALADMLDLSFDELAGDSGFKGDRDLDRFDTAPEPPRERTPLDINAALGQCLAFAEVLGAVVDELRAYRMEVAQ